MGAWPKGFSVLHIGQWQVQNDMFYRNRSFCSHLSSFDHTDNLSSQLYLITSRHELFCSSARSTKQRELIETNSNIQENIIENIRPTWKVGQVTSSFTEAFAAKGLGDNWIPGPVHGVGLEFEEWPHPSHYFGHAQLEIGENWTLAIGHSILPVKTVGGVKLEDTIQVTSNGGKKLTKTPTM